MRDPSLTTMPPMIDGIDLDVDLDGLAARNLEQRCLERLPALGVGERFGDA